MNKIITEEEFEIVDQKTILIKLKLDIYNLNDEFISSIIGKIINGNASIDADSDVRRTFSLTLVPDKNTKLTVGDMYLDDTYEGTKDQLIWIDKMVRVSIGIVNERTQETYWWKFGKFIFTNTNTTYDATTNQITINCADLMSNLDGSKNGELGQLSIVYPAYKEFIDGADDIFYSAEVSYNSGTNIYSFRKDDYNTYTNSDYFVLQIPVTNADNPKIRINTLPPIHIVDKDNRHNLDAGVLEGGQFYAFFLDSNKLVLCSEGPLGGQTEKDHKATKKAEYTCTTMESVPHYSFEGLNGEPNVGDMFLMHSEQLTDTEDYVLPRIPLIEFDTGNRYPILYYTEMSGYSRYYIFPKMACFPENDNWLPTMPDFGYTFPEQGYLRGQKWSKFHFRKYNNNCDPLLYVESGETVYQRMAFYPGRGEAEGEYTFHTDKMKITFIDDYSYTAEWTRKVKKKGKTETVTQTDYRTSEIYDIDRDYIRQFSKVILINLPGKIDNPNETYYNVFSHYWRTILKKDLSSDPHFLNGSVTNNISSKNCYNVSLPTVSTVMPEDSITVTIDTKPKAYDEWYKAGIPFKNDPYAPTDTYSLYWYEGVGGVPQTFPYDKDREEKDFYVDSTKIAPLELCVNGKQYFKIVDDKYNPISPSAFKEGEHTYMFYIDKRGQYATIVNEVTDDRPMIPYGSPLNYYTIRNAILTTVGQLAHIKRDTCEVDDVGEYRAMPEYNDEYKEYRETFPLWDNIPYDLEFSHGDNVLTILQKLRDLYPNYEMYFDENGTFCTNMIPSNNNDPILIPEQYFYNNIISENTSVDLTSVRNVCHAWGPVFEPDYYCDNGVYYDGTDGSKYVDVYDDYDNTDYTKVTVTEFDAGTNIYTCTTKDAKIDDFFNGLAYFIEPYYCLYTSLPRISDGTPKYVKYHYTYNTDGSVKSVTEEWYEPEEIPEFNTIPAFQIKWEDAEEEAPEYPLLKINKDPGTLKESQDYELLLYKTNEYHISSSSTGNSSSNTINTDIINDPYFPFQIYKIKEVTPIRFFDYPNCINAQIPSYDQYMTGDIIAIKMPSDLKENLTSLSLSINNLPSIPIYDENTYDVLGDNKIKANETYCFKIKKGYTKSYIESGTDCTAFLLGNWQVQAIAALVDSADGDPNQPYITTEGVTVNKYSKEYFQEIYACPSVTLVVMPNSPFTCQKIGEIMSVYIDETNLTSDALALVRAKYEIYLKARLIDSITVTTKLAPFADVNYKVGYRRQDNKVFSPYVVKNISHDLSGGTTTWQLMRFYPLYLDDSQINKTFNVTVQVDEGSHMNNVYSMDATPERNHKATFQPGETVVLGAEPRTGYHLIGWEVIRGGVYIDDNHFDMPQRDVIVRAIAAPNEVEIIYDANGGSPNPQNDIIPYGVNTNLNNGTSMECEDCEFLGWSENSTDLIPTWPVNTMNAEAFGYADNYDPDNPNMQTLYALWKIYYGLFETDNLDNLLVSWSNLVRNGYVYVNNGTITQANFNPDLPGNRVGDLVISPSISNIGNNAFETFSGYWESYKRGLGLTGVYMPSSITMIGSYAFRGDVNLKTLNLSETDNLIIIGTSAFADTAIKELELNGTDLVIDSRAFENCTQLESIDGLDVVSSIGEKTFANCDSLTEVIIPSTVEYLGNQAFADCDNLTSFIIEDGITRLTGYAPNILANDDNLSYVQIPASLDVYDDLETGDWCSNIQLFESSDEVTNHYPLLQTAGPIGGGYNVEFGHTTKIPPSLFYGLNCLETVVLPDTITEIGEDAFRNCKSLPAITLPPNLSILNNSVFAVCSSLQELTIPSNVTLLEQLLCWHCASLVSVTIPNSVTKIDHSAFAYCTSLQDIYFTSGTVVEWNAIVKEQDSFTSVPQTCIVHCFDGDIPLFDNT